PSIGLRSAHSMLVTALPIIGSSTPTLARSKRSSSRAAAGSSSAHGTRRLRRTSLPFSRLKSRSAGYFFREARTTESFLQISCSTRRGPARPFRIWRQSGSTPRSFWLTFQGHRADPVELEPALFGVRQAKYLRYAARSLDGRKPPGVSILLDFLEPNAPHD